MSKKARKQLMVQFMQSYRSTGQLFYKLLQAALQDEPAGTMALLPILKVLKQGGGMSQGAIARELFHSDAAISRQIGILAENGLVHAQPDKNNRRVTIVKLTEDGEKLHDKLETTVTDFLTDALSAITDEQLEQLIDSNSQLQTVITAKIGKDLHV